MSLKEDILGLLAGARFDLDHGRAGTETGSPLPTDWARTAPAQALRHAILRFGFAPLLAAELDIAVEGAEVLDRIEPPAIFVSNHASHLDAPLVLTALPVRWRDKTAVAAAADYFFGTRWLGAATALAFNAYPVGRERRGRRAAGLSRRLLAEGWSLLLFPEGSRSPDGWLGAFKPGAAALSLEHGVPVVPVALRGTYRAMPRGRSWPLPGRPPVGVRFGDPIRRRPGESAAALQRRVRAKLEATLEEDESSWWESLARHDDRASDQAPRTRWRRVWEASRPPASDAERRE